MIMVVVAIVVVVVVVVVVVDKLQISQKSCGSIVHPKLTSGIC
jgi:hypothetical protein